MFIYKKITLIMYQIKLFFNEKYNLNITKLIFYRHSRKTKTKSHMVMDIKGKKSKVYIFLFQLYSWDVSS